MNKFAKFSSIVLVGLAASACSEDDSPLGLEAALDRLPADGEVSAPPAPSPSIADIVVDLANQPAEEDREFTALLGAIEAADPSVLQTLSRNGKYTVFAPTDAAFEALAATGALDGIDQGTLTTVLLYHVSQGAMDASAVLSKQQIRMLSGDFARIDGAMAKIDGANIVATDIEASNGIIHVIDAVLLPPAASQQGNKDQPTILDLVADLGDDDSPTGFSILKAAVLASGDAVPATLDGNGQFTVFAPNNQAFLNLLAALQTTPQALLEDAELLNQVLLYHVARGRLMSQAVVSQRQLRMLDGNRIWIDGTTLNRDVNIIATDIETRNGVIHVIDGVLLPPTL